jgi:hypothetical protein
LICPDRSGEVADCGFLMLEYQKSSAAASHLAFGYFTQK